MTSPSPPSKRPHSQPTSPAEGSPVVRVKMPDEPLAGPQSVLDSKVLADVGDILPPASDLAFFDGASALILLSVIIKHSDNKLDQKYMDLVDLSRLLRGHNDLFEMTQKAWSAKQFQDIRNIATEQKKRSNFRGKAHEYLWDHMKHGTPYSVIVQSSGMGKSRLVDELSKNHFVIPMNLQLRRTGTALFIETCNVLTGHPEAVKIPDNMLPTQGSTRETMTTLFREYMMEGMTINHHGRFRMEFYAKVVRRAREEPVCTDAALETDELRHVCVLETLVEKLFPSESSAHAPTRGKPKPVVIMQFDGADALASDNNLFSRLHFVGLRKALRDCRHLALFSLFLSTTGKICDLVPANDQDQYSPGLIWQAFDAIPPLIDLGFDQMAYPLSLSNETNREIARITSDDVISHFGHPIFGARYDNIDGLPDDTIRFAATKLLADVEFLPGQTKVDDDGELACLARRLPLEFLSNTYALQKELRQMGGHMRLCLEMDLSSKRLTTISSSEPLLSEAAYWIMQVHDFDAPGTLLRLLDSSSVHRGDRGELVVMMILILARDCTVGPPSINGQPAHRWTMVPRFFECLFHPPPSTDSASDRHKHDDIQTTLGQTLSEREAVTCDIPFSEQFKDTRIYFNHFIKVHQQSFLDLPLLAALFYRGAAVFCGNNQPGIDGIIPMCQGPELIPSRMGAILWQSKNDPRYTSEPQKESFDAMDPWTHRLFTSPAPRHGFVPLIRIIFALAAETPSLRVVQVDSFSKRGFRTYDIWRAMDPGAADPGGHWQFLPPGYKDQAMRIEEDDDDAEGGGEWVQVDKNC
ncbi:hypothetical protein BJ138DRAFT_1182650 [Hygrophoropsis aurantiaca]|uniref:Uncharacterized protein n=1 Tax=Hygrophoropsis aurantiaca TaxID=72124 RepID=A0ACB8A273_9AGAM|nr:hypothetical protein BJ138DRAFT_1182650 [Hygrophoropsis aurantiaca]